MTGILKEAENTMAYFKAGISGFPGSGKTHTSTLLAIGICKRMNNNTIAFFDTETGSDFLLARLKAEGIKAFQVKSRAFNDLLTTIDECEQAGICVLIIDSITHVWRDLTESYKKRLGRTRLQFADWDVIKREWSKYTDAFVNSKLHIIVCGRAGYDYEHEVNEDGTKELIKSGTKMKVEGEFAYEPSLVIELERTSEGKEVLKELSGKTDRTSKSKRTVHQPRIGSKWIHRAYVLKDRTDTLNGEVFDYPTFEHFIPHFEALNIGGKHFGIDTSRTSEDRFDEDGNTKWQREKKRRDIALEELKSEVDKIYPSSSANEKKARIFILEHVFGTSSGTKLGTLTSTTLEEGVRYIRAINALPENTLENVATGIIKEPDYKTEKENLPNP